MIKKSGILTILFFLLEEMQRVDIHKCLFIIFYKYSYFFFKLKLNEKDRKRKYKNVVLFWKMALSKN